MASSTFVVFTFHFFQRVCSYGFVCFCVCVCVCVCVFWSCHCWNYVQGDSPQVRKELDFFFWSKFNHDLVVRCIRLIWFRKKTVINISKSSLQLFFWHLKEEVVLLQTVIFFFLWGVVDTLLSQAAVIQLWQIMEKLGANTLTVPLNMLMRLRLE